MNTLHDPLSVSIVITGSGGAGVMTAGQTLLDAATSCGLYGLMTRSTGPQIRGGEAAAMLRLSTVAVQCPGDKFDVLLALDFDNIQRFASELPLDAASVVIADPAAGDMPTFLVESGARVGYVELRALAKKVPGGRISMVALGALAQLLGLPLSAIVEAVAKEIGRKRPEAVVASESAVLLGSQQAPNLDLPKLPVSAAKPAGRWSITGNEMTGLGAIKGGVRFVAGYPITPATEILEWMATALPQCGGLMLQAEDELASINMVMGASFGGKPSLTATSGPGLSLMIETLGLAIASETPLVVVDVMRSGPSTGIATKSEQSDLNIAVYGLHGDAPHVVTAPLSVSDCLLTAQWSVHLAESLQTAVIMLSDQSIGQARVVIDRPEDDGFETIRLKPLELVEAYERYALTESGVSPMSLPGTAGGQYTADGLTHNAKGMPSSQAQDHIAQLNKRQRKIDRFDFGAHWAEIDGEGELAVLTWGSSSEPLREAIALAREQGVKVKLVAMRLISPPQPSRLAAALAGVKRVLVIEQNYSGQFWRYLLAHYKLPVDVVSVPLPGPLLIRPAQALSIILEGAQA
jgi:2-oxoglutarate ferredoxin oxidoreductase subunit alpha